MCGILLYENKGAKESNVYLKKKNKNPTSKLQKASNTRIESPVFQEILHLSTETCGTVRHF